MSLNLNKGQLAVTQLQPNVFYPIQPLTPSLLKGTVVSIYSTCDTLSVGDVITFDPRKATSYRQGTSERYLVNEEDILLREVLV